jgi:hypothetical protein
MEHAAQNGYDTTAYRKFYEDQHKQPLEIDAMSLEQVVASVAEFVKFTEDADFVDLTEASRETAAPPEPEVRLTVATKALSGANCTTLNHKEVSIEVTSYKVEKKQGLFGHDSVVFQVETEIPGVRFKYIVHRRDQDFH